MKRRAPNMRELADRVLDAVRREPTLGSLGNADLSAALDTAALLARNGRRLVTSVEYAARRPTSDPLPAIPRNAPAGAVLVCPVCEGIHLADADAVAVQCSCGGVAELALHAVGHSRPGR